jgi:hypothetical protein
MYEAKKIIRLEAIKLLVNGQSRIVCPFCNAKHETSLSLVRFPTGVFYKCWRVSCGEKGFIPSLPNYTTTIVPGEDKARPYLGRSEPLPQSISDWIFNSYEIHKNDQEAHNMRFDPDRRRLLIPVYTVTGYNYGLVAKKVPDSPWSGPKVSNYFDDGIHRLHFPFGGKAISQFSNGVSRDRKEIYIVEDVLSAIKLDSMLLPSVALLGTWLNSKHAVMLRNLGEYLYIVLDPDAKEQAVRLKQMYGLLFNEVHIVSLKKDPKDTKYSELAKVFGLVD